MELYMIRHGESEANALRLHSGWSPVNLSEKGRLQAQNTAKLLENTHFDAIFVSDIKRAQQTAGIIFPKRQFVFVPAIREINNTTMRGKNAEEMYALYGDKYLECRQKFDYAPLNIDCESGAHFLNRAGEALRFFERLPHERIAAVCHAGLIGAVEAYILKTPTHNPPISCDNASVNIFEFAQGEWKIKRINIV